MVKKIRGKTTTKSTTNKKARLPKLSDDEQVIAYMDRLQHPLKAGVEMVRTIIKDSNSNLSERIKWNAPSYYYKEDLVTFNLRALDTVHLVFHHIAITRIASPLLQGDYKDRRMVYFHDLAEIKAAKKELQRILRELVHAMEK